MFNCFDSILLCVGSEQFIQEIRRRLDAYFNLVLRNVRDTVRFLPLTYELYSSGCFVLPTSGAICVTQVPKQIGFFLVRQVQDKLQFELYNKLNDEHQFSSLLGEVRRVLPLFACVMNVDAFDAEAWCVRLTAAIAHC